MKHILKTTAIAVTLIAGTSLAHAAPEGFGIQYPEQSKASNIQSSVTDLTTQSVVEDDTPYVGEIKGQSDIDFDPSS